MIVGYVPIHSAFEFTCLTNQLLVFFFFSVLIIFFNPIELGYVT